MNDTPEPRPHAAKHSHLEIDGNRVKIKFSPGTLKAMQKLLDRIVENDKEHDYDVTHQLESLVSGKPVSVEQALVRLLMVSREVEEHAARTGDGKAHEALHNLESHLMGDTRTPEKQLVTVLVEPKAKGR